MEIYNSGVEFLSFEDAKKMLDTRDAVMVDVREELEYIQGHAEDALLLPVGEIDGESARDIIGDKDRTVILYCSTGKRSILAMEELKKLGYENVYSVGGLSGWPYGMD